MKSFLNRFFFFAGLVFLAAGLVLSSCVGPQGPGEYGDDGHNEQGGYLSLFLNLKEDKSPPLQMDLQSIDVLAETGLWHPLDPDTAIIDARTVAQGQIFLARGRLQTGNYSRLRIILKGATLQQQKGPVLLHVENTVTEIVIPSSLYLDTGDSHSLFLTWDVNASLQDGLNFTPVLQVAPRLKNLIADAAYVSCPEINTVFMVRTDLNRVYDSLGVSGGPAYLFSSPFAPEENLFALTVSEPGIKRIGPSVNKVVENYRLPMTGTATHMALDPTGRIAFVVDRQRGTVMRLNLDTGQIEKRMRLGYGPAYIIYLQKQDLLAVSLALSQSVVLLDPETLTSAGSIATGNSPEGMMLLNDTQLYIAESGGNSVLVYDLEKFRIWKRILVDLTPRRILAADGYIYVSNYGSKNISLLRPGQLSVSRNIPLSGAPLELADVPTARWIYVGNEEEKSISVVDPSSSRVEGSIPLGARPGGIAVIGR